MTSRGALTSTADIIDPSLRDAIRQLAFPGLLIGHRIIQSGDENQLMDREAASIASSATNARRASGAARLVARELLAALGHQDFPIVKAASGEPLWPNGIAGSLAHDDQIAIAAVGVRSDVGSIGVDIEPAMPLPSDVRDLAVTSDELTRLGNDALTPTIVFSAKEAVYKAAYHLDRVFLEFSDIAVDLTNRKAATRNGRTFTLRYCVSPRIIVLASTL